MVTTSLMIKIYTLAILSFLFILPSADAQTVIAKYAGEFINIGIGGRPLAMGGAFSAVANDITAGYYNPSGLTQINYPQISLMHDERYGNLVNYDYAAVAIPWDTDMSFALSVMRLGIDGIPDTRNALIDVNGNGKIDDNDRIDYTKITEFSDQDWAFYLSFAKKLADNFSYGASIKYLRRDIAEFNANGIGFDVGALYIPFENFSVGANLQDITTTLVAWNTGRNELITPTAKIGAAYGWDILNGRLTPAVDFDVRFENRQYASTFNMGPVSFDMHAGLEFNYNNLFSIRGGYNDVKQYTIGAGIKLPKLNIDYSFARFNASELDRLPDTHRISIILTLEEPRFLRTGM